MQPWGTHASVRWIILTGVTVTDFLFRFVDDQQTCCQYAVYQGGGGSKSHNMFAKNNFFSKCHMTILSSTSSCFIEIKFKKTTAARKPSYRLCTIEKANINITANNIGNNI